ncbi:uncharacterized protein DS421_16g540170 [Arachis hypogaea]|nr:uncharacterized protein DS421_16g540170 [Arachis hypogaea]
MTTSALPSPDSPPTAAFSHATCATNASTIPIPTSLLFPLDDSSFSSLTRLRFAPSGHGNVLMGLASWSVEWMNQELTSIITVQVETILNIRLFTISAETIKGTSSATVKKLANFMTFVPTIGFKPPRKTDK